MLIYFCLFKTGTCDYDDTLDDEFFDKFIMIDHWHNFKAVNTIEKQRKDFMRPHLTIIPIRCYFPRYYNQ